MSNPTVSFRISDYHLARGLRAIRHIEPSWKIITTSDLIRTIFNDYIAKSETRNNDPLAVTPELLQEIALTRIMVRQIQDEQSYQLPQLQPAQQKPNKSAQQIQKELEEERFFNQIKRESLEKQAKLDNQAKMASQDKEIDSQIALAAQMEKRTLHEAPKELVTDSKVTTVKDFSPPKEWIDEN